jgi:hypothetical protein
VQRRSRNVGGAAVPQNFFPLAMQRVGEKVVHTLYMHGRSRSAQFFPRPADCTNGVRPKCGTVCDRMDLFVAHDCHTVAKTLRPEYIANEKCVGGTTHESLGQSCSVRNFGNQ